MFAETFQKPKILGRIKNDRLKKSIKNWKVGDNVYKFPEQKGIAKSAREFWHEPCLITARSFGEKSNENEYRCFNDLSASEG